MNALVAGAQIETVVPAGVIPEVIACIGDRESRRSTNAAPVSRQTCVGNNVVADGRAIAAHNDDAASRRKDVIVRDDCIDAVGCIVRVPDEDAPTAGGFSTRIPSDCTVLAPQVGLPPP